MRRDMEYCIEIMQQIAKGEFPRMLILNNYFDKTVSDDEVEKNNKYFEHLKMLEDGGFIELDSSAISGGNTLIENVRIRWNGHDFLDMAENDGLWTRTKEAAKAKGFEIAKMPIDLLVSFTKMKAKEMLGIDIE